MQGTAILFSEMTPPAGQETTLDAWCDTQRIPARLALPGFLSVQRYRYTGESATGFLAVQPGGRGRDQAHAGRSALAIYEVMDTAMLDDAAAVARRGAAGARDVPGGVTEITEYRAVEFAVRRQVDAAAAALDAPLLYAVWFNVPADRTGDVDDWYEQEHIPILMECPAWLMARRFAITGGGPGPFNRLALHYLADRSALESPARFKARGTAWRARLAAEPWFTGTYKVFETHGPRSTRRVT